MNGSLPGLLTDGDGIGLFDLAVAGYHRPLFGMEGVGKVHEASDLGRQLAILRQPELGKDMFKVYTKLDFHIDGLCGGVDDRGAHADTDIVRAEELQAADKALFTGCDEKPVLIYR